MKCRDSGWVARPQGLPGPHRMPRWPNEEPAALGSSGAAAVPNDDGGRRRRMVGFALSRGAALLEPE